VRSFRRVVRSETSRFVLGPTRCQMGLSWERTILSKFRKRALSIVRSSRSTCSKVKNGSRSEAQIESQQTTKKRDRKSTYSRAGLPQLGQSSFHAFDDGRLDLLHRTSERLIELNDVCFPLAERVVDFSMEPTSERKRRRRERS
jgi:hypothetical protein